MSDWIEHDGKGMPIDGDVRVFVKFEDGSDDTSCNVPWRASSWQEGSTDSWSQFGSPKIVAYKVVSK